MEEGSRHGTEDCEGVYRNRTDLVEINIPAADDLFREIRIENTFIDVDRQQVALRAGRTA
jgi:hypothetical protein